MNFIFNIFEIDEFNTHLFVAAITNFEWSSDKHKLKLQEMAAWCENDNCGEFYSFPRKWFIFETEIDRMKFLLRWI